jgi:NitT/TauT family transport system ATP-binding protein
MERSVTMMLQLQNVSKEFGSGKSRVRTLQDINFEVNDGEIVAILGPSGCGKTTLLRIIAGLEKPSSGDVLLDGEKVEQPGPQLGMVFQEHALLPWLSVHRNVSVGLEMRGNTSLWWACQTAPSAFLMSSLEGCARGWPWPGLSPWSQSFS